MHTRPLLALIAALLMAAPLSAPAQNALADKRLAITKGTTPGKVLIEAPAAADAASAPPGAPSVAAAASAAVRSPPARPGLFSRLPPPSGRPLPDARRLDAPDQGIVVKSAPPAASPAR
ncbi:MAG: hypothetical protein KA711_14635 [Ideonella sp. WA131b]|jgi:hypothetical protein|nr:hypothetical protein [Ideonella sp. WA131b]